MNGFSRSKEVALAVAGDSTKPATMSESVSIATGAKAIKREIEESMENKKTNQSDLEIKHWLRELRLDQIENKKFKGINNEKFY